MSKGRLDLWASYSKPLQKLNKSFFFSGLQELEVQICVQPNFPIIILILLNRFHKFPRSRGLNSSAQDARGSTILSRKYFWPKSFGPHSALAVFFKCILLPMFAWYFSTDYLVRISGVTGDDRGVMGPVHERLAPKVDSTHKCPPAVWVDGVHKQISAMTQMPIYYQRETSQSYLSRKSVSGPDEKYCHVGLHRRWLSFALDAWSQYKSRYSSQFCQCIQNDMSNCQRLDMKTSNPSENQTKLQYIDSLVHLILSYCPMILVPTDLEHSCTIFLCCFDGEIQMIQTEIEIRVTRINELGN